MFMKILSEKLSYLGSSHSQLNVHNGLFLSLNSYIGNNNYCSATLLTNQTWGNAICNVRFHNSSLKKLHEIKCNIYAGTKNSFNFSNAKLT